MIDGQVSDLQRLTGPGPGLESASDALFAMPPKQEQEPAPKRARKPRAKPAPPTLAERLRKLALDGSRAPSEAFELKSAADTMARIERLAARDVVETDGLDGDNAFGYMYLRAMLAEALL